MILNTRVKKIICCALVVVCLVGTGVITNAETSSFTLTITRSGRDNDILSKRTVKSGGDRYENKCYVTLKSFTGKGLVRVKSIQLKWEAICSYYITFTNKSKINGTKKGSYFDPAHENMYYYLKGVYGTGSPSATLKLTGRYTP